MSFGSRQKGSVAEREVAKLIKTWWEQISPGCEVTRTPLSGGWGGPEIRSGFNASGDLMFTDGSFPWAVEIKRREGWSYDQFIAGKRSPVRKWWAQTVKAADEMNKEPMLWMRKNHMPWHIVLRDDESQWKFWPVTINGLIVVKASDFLNVHPKFFLR